MLEFFKKIFKKKELKEKDKSFLGIKKTEYNFVEWSENVLKQENFSLSLLDDLEVLFIKSDINVKTASYLITEIKKQIQIKNVMRSVAILPLIKEVIICFYQKNQLNTNNFNSNNSQYSVKKQEGPIKVVLFVGVNGVGKTTTIGKLAFKFKQEGQKVLLVAGDTFRTGAVEQLKQWAKNSDTEIFFKEGKNIPTSSVVFEALSYVKNQKFDVVLCDTSGRLENKVNLMKELEKVKRIIGKQIPGAPHETFLILDAMTGQHSLKQVKLFNQIVNLTSIILTKFDGISKGGFILNIKYLHNLSTKYIGNGENIKDLKNFDIKTYVDSLFGN
ncbi:signal recognition particle-docking protein FtsY ['Camptotheca acuminata' phytoplasma]|uniref:signal recognition particle-docking protein FtsY n=1 Tax='Camptotheca acuminata' phytoplasma TaxID=3239192 RepID=UPI00351A9185